MRLDLEKLASAFATARRIKVSDFMLSAAVVAQQQQAARAAEAEDHATKAGIDAAAEISTQGTPA